MPRNKRPASLPTSPLTARQVGATYEALRSGESGIPLEQFLCFARFPNWTATCYAEHWECSEDTASRDLRDLQRAGVIAASRGVATAPAAASPTSGSSPASARACSPAT